MWYNLFILNGGNKMRNIYEPEPFDLTFYVGVHPNGNMTTPTKNLGYLQIHYKDVEGFRIVKLVSDGEVQ
jgi:hypothetical protein